MSRTQPRRSRLPWLTVLAGVALIVVVTLLVWPTKVDGPLARLIRTVYASFGTGPPQGTVELAGFLANVALFVALAFLVGLATRRWWLGLAVGIAASVVSELVQVGLPGRNASIEDVIANSLGAAIGAGIALAVLTRSRTRTPES